MFFSYFTFDTILGSSLPSAKTFGVEIKGNPNMVIAAFLFKTLRVFESISTVPSFSALRYLSRDLNLFAVSFDDRFRISFQTILFLFFTSIVKFLTFFRSLILDRLVVAEP